MSKKIDLDTEIGQRFGMLVVIGHERRPYTHPSGKTEQWPFMHVHCDCGGESWVRRSSLKDAYTLSCGCWMRQQMSDRASTHGEARHGMRSAEWLTWQSVRRRCYDTRCKEYASYGGRGIKVDDRWVNSYESFLADMGRKPSPKHSIDRINGSLGYSASNCRWATSKEQNRNRSSNRNIAFNGERKTLIEWSEQTGISRTVISSRLNKGWDVGLALSIPARPRVKAHA